MGGDLRYSMRVSVVVGENEESVDWAFLRILLAVQTTIPIKGDEEIEIIIVNSLVG